MLSVQSEGPQPLVRETREGAPYPVAALGPLRETVEAVQAMILAPVALAAQSALAVASLALQGLADVETLADPCPLSLFLLTVAGSGERKSACYMHFSAALREFERTEADANRLAMQSWRNKHALWKAEREVLLSAAKKPKAAGGAAIEAKLDALGPEPAAPPLPGRTVTEPTLERAALLTGPGSSAG